MVTQRNKGLWRFACFPLIAPLVFTLLWVVLFPPSVRAMDILLGTGEAGSFSHFTGRTVCRIVNRHVPDLNCKVIPATGDIHNLTNLQGGSIDIALVDSRMLNDAFTQAGYFEFLEPGIFLRPKLEIWRGDETRTESHKNSTDETRTQTRSDDRRCNRTP